VPDFPFLIFANSQNLQIIVIHDKSDLKFFYCSKYIVCTVQLLFEKNISYLGVNLSRWSVNFVDLCRADWQG
jgi:hypothetical protein